MIVRMLRGTGGPDGTACFVGEVYDLPDALAQSWVMAGRAEAVTDAQEGPIVAHGDPVPQVAPAPTKRRRGVST